MRRRALRRRALRRRALRRRALRRRALLRLIAYAESHDVWKNAIGKTGVPVFLSSWLSFCVV
ncbi:MAG: hypothetical protein Q7J08_05405 [Methanocorpusculum sp.]|uniref:hypothetical protein n=1 Tax=Methanocorpusculum sp. TaxID=2058474 RepID=UPI0027166FD9|nr:hypothetical protein [Methanocorpusculum sp.]MDO9523135.1 hypothetical protein [Methanocorpusculum sp.]